MYSVTNNSQALVGSEKLNLKDVAFLAIISVVLLLISGMVMPIVMFTNIFALRQLVSAPLYALFYTIALMKVGKRGALMLMGVFTSVVLLFMSPIMFFNQLLGALLTELFILALYRNYATQKAIVVAAVIYTPITLPLTLLVNNILKGKSLAEQFGEPFWPLVCCVGCFVLGAVGAWLGTKLGNELRKAGKI